MHFNTRLQREMHLSSKDMKISSEICEIRLYCGFYIFCLYFPSLCTYIYIYILSVYLCIHIHICIHTYFHIYVFGYTWMEQIWVNKKYYSLSIAQNESPIINVINLIMHLLFLSPCECLCTMACVHACIKKNLLIAVCVHACLQLNWIDPRVKRAVTNPGTTHGP